MQALLFAQADLNCSDRYHQTPLATLRHPKENDDLENCDGDVMFRSFSLEGVETLQDGHKF